MKKKVLFTFFPNIARLLRYEFLHVQVTTLIIKESVGVFDPGNGFYLDAYLLWFY